MTAMMIQPNLTVMRSTITNTSVELDYSSTVSSTTVAISNITCDTLIAQEKNSIEYNTRLQAKEDSQDTRAMQESTQDKGNDNNKTVEEPKIWLFTSHAPTQYAKQAESILYKVHKECINNPNAFLKSHFTNNEWHLVQELLSSL
jgi:hypothetical protein